MWERSNAFWVARDNWRQATIKRQNERKPGKYAPPKLENTARKWALKGAQYLGNWPGVVKAPGAMIEIDPAIREDMLKLLEGLAPKLAESFDSVLPDIVFNAWRNWPVASGYSKSSLILSYLQAGDSFSAKIGCAAPYTVFIQGSPQIQYLQKPAAEAAPKIGAMVAK